MFFVIHATDKPDALQTRAKFYRVHRTHLEEGDRHGVKVLMAGPLVADDGETPIGSLLVFDAPDRGAVEAFCNADPYSSGGVWETVQVHAYVSRRAWASPSSTGI